MNAITALRPFLPPALLQGAAWERLCGCVQGLPTDAVQYCGFEFRLGVDEPAADLFIAAFPDEPSGRHFMQLGESEPATSPAGALARHLQALAAADSELGEVVEITGLEYDIAEVPPGERPPPGVFFKLCHALRHDPALTQRALKALASAVGWDDGADVREAVDRALAALPPTCGVSFIGALPGRSLRAVRLIVGGVNHSDVAATLTRLGWRGSAEAAAALLEELRPVLPTFRLALDVAAVGLGPQIGFELFAKSRSDQLDSWLTTARTDWRPVMTALVERGWCLPAKAAGLLDWCSLERLYDEQGMVVLQKGVNHVKVTLVGGAAGDGMSVASVKGYGGVLHARPE